MSIHIEQYRLSTRPAPGELARLSLMLGEHGRVTVLVPDFGVRGVLRRALAEAGLGVGIEVATVSSWIQGLWELVGDGRHLVSEVERRLLMARALAEHISAASESELSSTSGTVSLLVRLVREHAAALLGPMPDTVLSRSELELVAVAGRYARLIEEAQLIEPSVAAHGIAGSCPEALPASARALVIRGVHQLPAYALELIEAVGAQGTVRFVLEDEVSSEVSALAERFGCALPVRGGVPAPSLAEARVPQVRCAEVAGPTARDAAYAKLVSAAEAASASTPRSAAGVVVATSDPLATFRSLAPRLAAAGISSEVHARLSFSDTRAGQVFVALVDLLDRMDHEEASSWWPAPEVTDWLRSPFSGLAGSGSRLAKRIDAWMRKTRALTKRMLFDELGSLQSREMNYERTRSEREGREARPIVVKAVLEALACKRYYRALQLMASCADAASSSQFGEEGASARRAELTALETVLAFMDGARRLGVSEEQAYLVLPDVAVPYAVQASPGEGDPVGGMRVVAFANARDVSSEAPSSRTAALLLDADMSSYPVGERDDPGSVLAEKFDSAGIAAMPSERLAARFRHVAEVSPALVVAYVARDRQGEKRYPALFWADARALEKAGAAAAEPALVAALTEAASSLPTEGALFSNLDRAAGVGARRESVRVGCRYAVAEDLHELLLLPQRSLGSRVVPRTLSASQIENYLACPYRWLASNRASSRSLDVGFGPIEMGNFVHDVMQRFHERLIEVGLNRVTSDALDACLAEMDQAFEEIRLDHHLGKYTHGKYAGASKPRAIRSPLIALDEIERNVVAAILPKLHEVVRYESDMLSIYAPACFEYSFDREQIEYAGHAIGGRIDRIDTAPDAGSGERFVVIDYKNRSSVADLATPDPTMMLEGDEKLPTGWLPGRANDKAPKVQTLIYAQALERAGAGSAQGAVYFGTRGPQVAGAVSAALVASEPPAFPHDKVSGYPGKKSPRSRTAKQDGCLEFQQLLDRVEESIALELDALHHGAIAPAPAADSCTYCPISMCEKRR